MYFLLQVPPFIWGPLFPFLLLSDLVFLVSGALLWHLCLKLWQAPGDFLVLQQKLDFIIQSLWF